MPITQAPDGGGQFDRVEPYSEYDIAAAATLAQNWVYFVKCRTERTILIGGIEFFVGGVTDAAGHVDVGVFTFNGTTYTQVSSSGATTPGAINTMQRVALLTPIPATPFTDIILAIVTDSATLVVGQRAAANAGALARVVRAKGSSYPLPSSATLASTSTTSAAPYLAGVA